VPRSIGSGFGVYIMVKIFIGNTKCKLDNLIDPLVKKAIDLKLSYDIQGFKFMKLSNKWDGRYRLLTKNNYFPVGMLEEVIDILKVHKVIYKVIDQRLEIQYGTPILPAIGSKFVARDYQDRVINRCISKGSGIIRVSTGGGKSFIIASLIAHYNVPSIIYVVSIDLLYQMVDTLRESFGIDAGIIGDGNCDIKKINVMTIWSAGSAFGKKLSKSSAEDIKVSRKKLLKKEQIRDAVRNSNLLILDEAQYSGSDTFQLLAREAQSSRHRFLFSGTPWRENGDDILLEAVAGKKIIDIDASYLIKRGFLVRPTIIFKDVPTMRGVGKTYQEVYSNYIVNNDERNDMAVSTCKNFEKKGLKTLILIRNINHGEIISKKLSDAGVNHLFLTGVSSSGEREAGINDIKEGNIHVVVASTIFDIGIDIPSLTALINLGGGKSTGKVLQRIGRVIRSHPGKSFACVVDFYDQCKYLREHSQVRFKTIASESEFSLRRVK